MYGFLSLWVIFSLSLYSHPSQAQAETPETTAAEAATPEAANAEDVAAEATPKAAEVPAVRG